MLKESCVRTAARRKSERMRKISVIVPVYNAEKYLDRCIGSILAQTFRDFELILVEDGSPDRCAQMCDEWAKKDERIKVIHQSNSGPSTARNVGIAASQGEYLTFVDSDDRISPFMLEKLLRAAKKTGADIVTCAMVRDNGKALKMPIGKDKLTVYSRDSFMDIMLKINGNRNVHYVCAKLYKRSVTDSHLFPQGFMLGEDVESSFKAVMRSERIAELSGEYYFYYENPQSTTRVSFSQNYIGLRMIWKRVLAICERYAPQYADKVRFNLIRSDFTILMQSILLGSRQTDKVYRKELGQCLKRLRANIGKLLTGPMVLRRKIAAAVLCCAYRQVRAVYRLARR